MAYRRYQRLRKIVNDIPQDEYKKGDYIFNGIIYDDETQCNAKKAPKDTWRIFIEGGNGPRWIEYDARPTNIVSVLYHAKVVDGEEAFKSMDFSFFDSYGTLSHESIMGGIGGHTDVSQLDTSAPKGNDFGFTLASGEYTGANELDITGIDSLHSMFSNCMNVYLDLSKWNTMMITDMGYMFNRATKLKYLLIDNFDVRNVSEVSSMFYSCYSLKYIRCKKSVKDWIIENASRIGFDYNILDDGISHSMKEVLNNIIWDIVDSKTDTKVYHRYKREELYDDEGNPTGEYRTTEELYDGVEYSSEDDCYHRDEREGKETVEWVQCDGWYCEEVNE